MPKLLVLFLCFVSMGLALWVYPKWPAIGLALTALTLSLWAAAGIAKERDVAIRRLVETGTCPGELKVVGQCISRHHPNRIPAQRTGGEAECTKCWREQTRKNAVNPQSTNTKKEK